MFRAFAVAALTATASLAPVQCGTESNPESAFEETPGEALYLLASEFKQAGDTAAWQRTLEYLVERYPSSRFAAAAQQDLAAAGVTPANSAAASAQQ